MSDVALEGSSLRLGERFSVQFQRTLRVPGDGREYPLPPGLGAFPLHEVGRFARRVPSSWRRERAFFFPMYRREAMWLVFNAAYWKPNAVKVGVGGINAVSGEAWSRELRSDPQNYLVVPIQPWLDGINAGVGSVQQFVAVPLGSGYTVEAQLTGREERGGIQIIAYEPKPSVFPDRPPPMPPWLGEGGEESAPPVEMGFAAGGKIRQRIYPDPYGLDTWDVENYTSAWVYIVDSEQYKRITGLAPPPSPITAQTYTSVGLPWFDLYDEGAGDVAPGERLAHVKTTADLDALMDADGAPGDPPIDIARSQIETLPWEGSDPTV